MDVITLHIATYFIIIRAIFFLFVSSFSRFAFLNDWRNFHGYRLVCAIWMLVSSAGFLLGCINLLRGKNWSRQLVITLLVIDLGQALISGIRAIVENDSSYPSWVMILGIVNPLVLLLVFRKSRGKIA